MIIILLFTIINHQNTFLVIEEIIINILIPVQLLRNNRDNVARSITNIFFQGISIHHVTEFPLNTRFAYYYARTNIILYYTAVYTL